MTNVVKQKLEMTQQERKNVDKREDVYLDTSSSSDGNNSDKENPS